MRRALIKLSHLLLMGSLSLVSTRMDWCARAEAQTSSAFLESFPHLKQYVFVEPKSAFRLGFGVSPIGVLKDRLLFSANFFQLHWVSDSWDHEILNVAYGFTNAQPTYIQSNHFTFRTSPKLRIGRVMSVGPVAGYEFVSFSKINSVLYKAPYSTPTEPFSTRGFIYGLMLSETFTYKNDYLIKFNQVAYQQTYSTSEAANGWQYVFDQADLRKDPGPIKSGLVVLLEASILY